MRMRRWVVLLLAVSLTLSAQEESLDDLLGGFDDTAPLDIPELDIPQEEGAEPSIVSTYGSIGFSTAYNYAHEAPQTGMSDHRGVSRARTKFDLTLDAKFTKNWRAKLEMKAFYDAIYALKGRDGYTDDMLETYEREAEFKEAYVQGSLTPSLDVKLGRQIVVWGKSDNIRITDVINPLDNREPGMVDIEDLRLPVVMSKVDYYSGAWNVSLMAIHESRIQKEAAVGSDFLPTHIFPLPGNRFPEVETPDSNLDDTQFAFAANGRFSGWDLSTYAAEILDNRWHLHRELSGVLTRRYGKMGMVGLSANFAYGNWLLKAESALLSRLRYSSVTERKNRLDTLAGVDYMGLTDTTLSLEIANRHLYEYEAPMEDAPDFAYGDEQQVAFRATHDFNHEKGTLALLYSLFTAEGKALGGFSRVWCDYELSDNLNGSVGVIDYTGGDKAPLEAMKENDRVFAEIVWGF